MIIVSIADCSSGEKKKRPKAVETYLQCAERMHYKHRSHSQHKYFEIYIQINRIFHQESHTKWNTKGCISGKIKALCMEAERCSMEWLAMEISKYLSRSEMNDYGV